MKRLLPVVLVILAVLAFSAGCSRNDLGVAPRFGVLGGGGAQDSIPPKPHPTPPPDTTIIPVQFLSADSTNAGTTGASRWRLGNPNRGVVTYTWTLTAPDSSWPGYPIQGTQRIGPSRTVDISVPVPVPGFAITGIYSLELTVLTSPSTAVIGFGSIRVFGNNQPPPPPTPAVVFAGSDSAFAGQTAHTSWQLHNESSHDFTMSWSLSSPSGWPGLPKQGTVALGPNATQILEVDVAVPDTAAAGPRPVDMQVSRPDGLPPESSPGFIQVLR